MDLGGSKKMRFMMIKKRDGSLESFQSSKIAKAIEKAFLATIGKKSEIHTSVEEATNKTIEKLEALNQTEIEVEEVQDLVEQVLVELDYFETAKMYILYREERTNQRKRKAALYKQITEIMKQTHNENANVGNSPSGRLLQIAEAANKDYADSFLTSDLVKKAKDENIIYVHDESWFAVGTTTCSFIPLSKLLKNGFDSGHGFVRSPKRIKSAASLAAICLQSNQNEQHGGQAFGWFDRDLAPFVHLEYEWQLNNIKDKLQQLGIEIAKDRNQSIEELAWKETEKETFQAMEALVFNLNTMHSRAGAQIPFSSINIGTDVTKEGRLVSESLLKAYEKGLGNGEQPIFPNIVFKVKDGINWKIGDANFDHLQLAMRVSSTRLFPNFVFMDSTLNADFPEDVPVMGCRTRVAWNVNQEKQTCDGRGNLSFTTINLVGVAFRAGDEAITTTNPTEEIKQYVMSLPERFYNDTKIIRFFTLLSEYADITIVQLLERLAFQSSFQKKDFPFLYHQTWMDGEKLTPTDTLIEVLKNGSLAVGFIGLAESLLLLTGKHHGEDDDVEKLAFAIISFLRKKTDEATKKYQLNFGVLATPAEGLSGKFVKKDRDSYGIVKGITDKEWYTNSFHIPVDYKITIFEKIKKEGQFHKLCNGGTISYVELKEAPEDNLSGYHTILRAMKDSDMSYVALNFPVDRCKSCGYSGLIESDTCPNCQGKKISKIRRITGYLSDLTNFNAAKAAEEKNRVKHG